MSFAPASVVVLRRNGVKDTVLDLDKRITGSGRTVCLPVRGRLVALCLGMGGRGT